MSTTVGSKTFSIRWRTPSANAPPVDVTKTKSSVPACSSKVCFDHPGFSKSSLCESDATIQLSDRLKRHGAGEKKGFGGLPAIQDLVRPTSGVGSRVYWKRPE